MSAPRIRGSCRREFLMSGGVVGALLLMEHVNRGFEIHARMCYPIIYYHRDATEEGLEEEETAAVSCYTVAQLQKVKDGPLSCKSNRGMCQKGCRQCQRHCNCSFLPINTFSQAREPLRCVTSQYAVVDCTAQTKGRNRLQSSRARVKGKLFEQYHWS